MLKNNFFGTLLICICTISFINCKIANKSGVSSKKINEGYVHIEGRAYKGVDEHGEPVDRLTGYDSMMSSMNRTMWLKDSFMIEMETNTVLENEKYMRTDTTGYRIYYFPGQRFFEFKTMEPGAKVVRTGAMADPEGSYANTPALDPMNGIPDSAWQVRDTVVNGESLGIVSFRPELAADSAELELYKKAKFWVNYDVKDFPLQLSYQLSAKLRHGFVYKMHLPAGDNSMLLVVSLHYQPAKLQDTVSKVFESWSQWFYR